MYALYPPPNSACKPQIVFTPEMLHIIRAVTGVGLKTTVPEPITYWRATIKCVHTNLAYPQPYNESKRLSTPRTEFFSQIFFSFFNKFHNNMQLAACN